MSDDPARMMDTPADTGQGPFEEAPAAQPYIQLIEAEAPPLGAADALERRDAYGRVPVIVRIRRQPPINPIWILVAVGLAASGVVLPLATALRAMIVVAAVAAVVVGIMSRLFIRVPPGSVGLVVKGGRHQKVLGEGNHVVNPMVALSHVVTTRDIAFDVPVTQVRSADGVGVAVDVLLTLRISDPVKFAYSITPGDADQFVQASSQDAVRMLVRSIEAMALLDLGPAQADSLRAVVDPKLEAYGIGIMGVAVTRVTLPAVLTDSLEARRLASLQLAEQTETFALSRRRLADQTALVAQEAESRRIAVEWEAAAEELRLAKLEQRIAANPNAARYDLEASRLRVAERLAGNSRAVVSLGGSDLLTGLLMAREAGPGESGTSATPPTTDGDGATPAA